MSNRKKIQPARGIGPENWMVKERESLLCVTCVAIEDGDGAPCESPVGCPGIAADSFTMHGVDPRGRTRVVLHAHFCVPCGRIAQMAFA